METKKFIDILEIYNGKNQKSVENPDGKYPIYGSGGVMGRADEYICPAETVVIGRKGSINNPIFVTEPFWNVDTAFGLVAKKEVLFPKYLFYFCRYFDFEKLNTTVTIPSLTKANLLKIEIPIPSIIEQKSIVTKLNLLTDMIQQRQEQLTKLDELIKARFVEMFGDFEFNPKKFPIYLLCNLCDVGSSKRIYQEEQSTSGIPFLKISDLVDLIDAGTFSASTFIPSDRYERLCSQGLTPKTNDVLITSRGTLGKCYIVKKSDEFYFQDGMISWLSNISEKVSSTYISYLFMQPYIQKQILALQAGSTVAYLSISMLKRLNIILPPLSLQNQFAAFVAEVDKSKLFAELFAQSTCILAENRSK